MGDREMIGGTRGTSDRKTTQKLSTHPQASQLKGGVQAGREEAIYSASRKNHPSALRCIGKQRAKWESPDASTAPSWDANAKLGTAPHAMYSCSTQEWKTAKIDSYYYAIVKHIAQQQALWMMHYTGVSCSTYAFETIIT